MNDIKKIRAGGGTDNYNYAISLLRLISTVLIVACHCLQWFGSELAWWFNVGVQIFLCISGYLYGKGRSQSVIQFYKHRIIKILLPYYIVFLAFSLAIFVVNPAAFDYKLFLGGLLLRKTIQGGEHLWFIPYILLCYLITPLLNSFRDEYIRNSKSWLIFTAMSIVIAFIILGLFDRFFNPAWITCYILGYCLAINDDYISTRIIVLLFGFLAFIGNGIQVYLDYVIHHSFNGLWNTIYQYIKYYNHSTLGIFLFLLGLKVFEASEMSPNWKVLLRFSDYYSYEIYLIHQFIILGPLSLMGVTPVIFLNIVMIMAIIMFLSLLLKKSEQMILNMKSCSH